MTAVLSATHTWQTRHSMEREGIPTVYLILIRTPQPPEASAAFPLCLIGYKCLTGLAKPAVTRELGLTKSMAMWKTVVTSSGSRGSVKLGGKSHHQCLSLVTYLYNLFSPEQQANIFLLVVSICWALVPKYCFPLGYIYF